MQKFLATISHILHKWGNFFGRLSGEKQPWQQKPASTPLPDLGDGAKDFDGEGNAQVQQIGSKKSRKMAGINRLLTAIWTTITDADTWVVNRIGIVLGCLVGCLLGTAIGYYFVRLVWLLLHLQW